MQETQKFRKQNQGYNTLLEKFYQNDNMTLKFLINEAIKERYNARAIFSNFKVGAILVTEDDKIYRGSNIEISSFGLTICAERVAIFKAVSEGEKKFKSIFIASDSDKITPPCGACRQVLWELAGNIDVIMINRHGKYKQMKMENLLPISFDESYF